MFLRKNKENIRYVARGLNWKPIFNIETGVIDDLRPDEKSILDRTGPGWEHITTLSNAKRIARWANRKESR